ncbi:hypothetical protein PsYK624_064160 [Phanerochaete sordida]|uniref:Uncharacterized protein n=1 Tax=Phanerochaete sordida TaxID=48140 RepID=A0A9P3G911_9APHY|nr:hypothetical protein PsYK624_064160 [Phanerochaete sordida]
MNGFQFIIGPPAQAQPADQIPSWIVQRGWNIINLDKREYVLFPMPPSTPESGMFGYEFNDVMWPLVEPVMMSMEEVLPKHALTVQKPVHILERGTTPSLHTLPLDVLLLIFDAIENLRDATALCLTNSGLTRAGQRRVKRLSEQKWPTWSGDCILALAGLDDRALWAGGLPPSLQAHPDVVAAVERAGGFARHLQTFRPLKRVRCPPSLRELAHDRLAFDWRRFGGASLCHYPLDATWAVCNASRREYVRLPRVAEGLLSPAGASQGAHMWGRRSQLTACVGRSVPVRIACWTNGTGAWAADRLTICTLESAHAKNADWGEWEDVTSAQDPIKSGLRFDPWNAAPA